jgi:hypothetical protein
VPEEEFDFLGRVSVQLRTIRRAALARLTTFERALLWRWWRCAVMYRYAAATAAARQPDMVVDDDDGDAAV